MLPNNHNNSRKINYKSTCTSSLLKYPYIHFFYESQKISRNVKDLSQEVKVNHEETQL